MDSVRRKPKRKIYRPQTIRTSPTPQPAPRARTVFVAPKKIPTAQKRPIQPPRASKKSFRQLFAGRPFSSRGRSAKRKFSRKILWGLFWIVLSLVLIASASIGLLAWKASRATHSAIIGKDSGSIVRQAAKYVFHSNAGENNLTKLRSEEDGRINVLLLGKGGKNYPGQNLTDTLIVASIDTKTGQTALMSIPRDLYVNIPGTDSYTKINALYHIGQEEDDNHPAALISKSIEEITGQPIHYFLAVDYDGFTRIIDALGGINVEVERDIKDVSFPGPNYSYETFELSAGFHHLDGATALKYVRERHDDPMGDFGRSHRQQQVIQAVKNRAFTVGTFLDPVTLYKLLDALEDTVRTDITLDETESFLHLAENVDIQNINTTVVDAWQKESLLRVSHIDLDNGQQMFALVPRTGNYTEIQDAAKEIFEKNALEKRRADIVSEETSVGILNYSGDASLAGKIQTLLTDLGFGTVNILQQENQDPLPKTYVRKNASAKKPFSLDELLKKVPASISIDSMSFYMPKEDTSEFDFLLFLGEDIVENYNWEEVSVEEYINAKNDE